MLLLLSALLLIIMFILYCYKVLLCVQIIWEPYTDAVLQYLPTYCLNGRDIWRALVPLICIHIVEWHYPNRVLRQFGFMQSVPHQPFQMDALHVFVLRDHDVNWAEKYERWVEFWERRVHSVVSGQPSGGSIHYHSGYLEWYRERTRRWISPTSARLTLAVCFEFIRTLIDFCYHTMKLLP